MGYPSPEDRCKRNWLHFTKSLETVPEDEWEVWGLIGKGYSDSLYKLYARRRPRGRWYWFEGFLRISPDNPVSHWNKLAPSARLPPSHVVHGGVDKLLGLCCMPERKALVRGLSLLQALAAGKSAEPFRDPYARGPKQ